MTVTVSRPPFDPSIERALADNSEIVVVSMTAEDIPRVRALSVEVPLSEATMHGEFERAEHRVPGLDGGPDVRAFVYTPVGLRRPAPVILHLHGGGLITGTADSDIAAAVDLAAHAGCAVVSVEYRLAPEHPYPAALEDATAVLAWLASPAAPRLLDAERIIVSGVSAGGGLAAATALYARDHDGPLIAGLLLACPMLDDRSDSFSARQMAGAGSWDATANATAWRAYTGASAEDPVSPYASPARCADLGGLPPTFVDVGSAETFRDECVDFADRIWRSGGQAELHVWPGGAHAFDFLAPWAPLSRDARMARAAWLRRLLARL
jgi:acetyl esterase/lipase